MKDEPATDYFPYIVVFVIIAIALFGGIKSPSSTGLLSNTSSSTTQSVTEEQSISNEQKITDTEKQIDILKKQIQLEQDKLTQSRYKGLVKLYNINRTSDSDREYISIIVEDNATTTIPVTGWVLKSLSTGIQVSIPKGTYLYFLRMVNVEDNIILTGGDKLYLITGMSPIGLSFLINKCTGYLGQFQNFVPYLSSNCPLPKNEDLSSIPRLVINDKCFDYIDYMSRCRVPTDPLPVNWSAECKNFITNKINYSSCIDTHKSDKDFYMKEWMVYLKRNERLWKDRRETVVLYDNEGKIVDTLKY